MKLLIGIPTSGAPARPFLDSLAGLRLPESVDEVDRVVWNGNFVAAQREMIVREAVRRGVDLLAMIDDDIVVPPEGLVKLVAALDADPLAAVAGALYYSRDGARPIAVTRWDPRDTSSAAIPAFNARGPALVDGVGFGLVVLRVEALAALSVPYFAAHVYVDETTRWIRQCDEDYLLCERFRRDGRHVLLHGGVRAGHYDRETQTVHPVRWETDEETDRLRMIVREGDRTKLVPFDDAVSRVVERHERFDVTLLRVGAG